jgi:hypothetical protein
MGEMNYDTFLGITPAPADYAHWRRQLQAMLAGIPRQVSRP